MVDEKQFLEQHSVCCVSHVDLDGAGSEIAVWAAVGNKVNEYKSGYVNYPNLAQKAVDFVIGQEDQIKGKFDHVFLTDLSFRNNKDGSQDADIMRKFMESRPNTNFYWFDHHSSSQVDKFFGVTNLYMNVDVTECEDKSKMECGASIVLQDLKHMIIPEEVSEDAINNAKNVIRLCELARDYDLWIKKLPRSTELSDVISMFGIRQFCDMIKADLRLVTKSDSIMQWASTRASNDRQESIDLALRTSYYTEIGGWKIRFALCSGYVSEVGHAVAGQDRDVAACILDMDKIKKKELTISFRRHDESEVDLKKLAEACGGGGHVYASGAELTVTPVTDAIVDTFFRQVIARILVSEKPDTVTLMSTGSSVEEVVCSTN